MIYYNKNRQFKKFQNGGIMGYLKSSYLNPMNWGVDDYTDKYKSFGDAYAAARRNDLKEFIYNGKRYNTKNSGTKQQQINMYGNTNELNKYSINTLKRFADYDAKFLNKSATPEKYLNNPTENKNQAERDRSEQLFLDRLLHISELAGDPEITHRGRNTFFSKNRSTFSPIANRLNLAGDEGLIPEYAHAYRNKQEGSEVLSFIKSWLKKPWITPSGQEETYNTIGQMEHDTHSVVEPTLQRYYEGRIDEDIIPSEITERRALYDGSFIKNRLHEPYRPNKK